MRILDNTKSLSALSIDTTNGLGNIQPLECLITEELNGLYEAEMTVLVSDEHFNDLSVGSILLLNTEKDMQMFRVYYISKPINQRCEIRLQHITYDLTKTPVKPFNSTGAVASCLALENNVLGSTPFNIQTNIENTTSNFTLDIPRSFRECLGGYEGSMLDVFRGEYEWDNLTVKMLSRRGADNGVRISYGKNLTDFKQEENIENVYDGVLGYAVVDDITYTASNYFNKTGATNPRILNVDFSSDYESGQIPTDAELIQKETNYANNNDIEIPNVNITVSFIPLWQTEEYKNVLPLERVSLGDTVHIYFDKLNVEASARVIKTVWNCLTEKYEEIELGNAKANLNTVIDNAVDSGVNKALSDLDIDTSSIETEMNNLSRLIVNGLGLHISKDDAGRIILHNEETIAQSQYQYRISAQGFVVSDDYGQNWRSGWTTSGEAYMNSLSTIILRAMQIYGSVITFGDPNDKYIVAQSYSNGVTFDGSGTIRLRPQEQFIINNLTADGTHSYNTFNMNKNGSSSNYISLTNYDDTQNYLTANFIELNAHLYNSSTDEYYNRTILNNYSTASGTQNYGNYLSLAGYSDRNLAYLYNYKPLNAVGDTALLANYLQFTATSTSNGTFLYNYQLSSNHQANRFSMGAYSSSNTMTLVNNKTGGNYLANRIQVDSSSTYNAIELNNIKTTRQTTTGNEIDRGNRIYLQAQSTFNSIEINNYRPTADSTLLSNRVYMYGVPTGGDHNSFIVYNYDVDGANIANAFELYKSSSFNDIRLSLYRGGTNVAYIYASRYSDGSITVGMGVNSNDTYGYKQANIACQSDGTVAIWGQKVNFNGTQKW